jgi:hypothetical protein
MLGLHLRFVDLTAMYFIWFIGSFKFALEKGKTLQCTYEFSFFHIIDGTENYSLCPKFSNSFGKSIFIAVIRYLDLTHKYISRCIYIIKNMNLEMLHECWGPKIGRSPRTQEL